MASRDPHFPGTGSVSRTPPPRSQVQPKTGPQDAATSTLLDTIRTDVIPSATAGTGVTAYVGGATAVTDDFTGVLSDALPAFLLVVVSPRLPGLDVAVPLVPHPADGGSDVVAQPGRCVGATVAVFQWGNLASLFVTSPGRSCPSLPVMLFAILFGLSMDYQVFLVSRMQEEGRAPRTTGSRSAAG